MQDPKKVKLMAKMMKSIDRDSLTSMGKQTGMDITPEMADQISGKLESMDEATLEQMVKVGGHLAGLLEKLRLMWRICFGSYWRAAATILLLSVFFDWFFSVGFLS